MELTDFRKYRDNASKIISPHKVVRLDEIKQVEGEVFNVSGIDLEMSPKVIDKLNGSIGTSKRQLQEVRNCSGVQGETNFRNYLTVANSMTSVKEVVLIADPDAKVVTNLLIPKQQFIPVDAFFDFAELFIDSTNMRVEKIESSLHGEMDIVIYLQQQTPQISTIVTRNDFTTDGLYLKWDGDSIELGNYYVRLVCLNGQTQQINQMKSRVYDFTSSKLTTLIKVSKNEEIIHAGLEQFKKKAREAIETFVSLRELTRIYGFLQAFNTRVPEAILDQLVPYKEIANKFKMRGINLSGREHLAMSHLNWWDLYNDLTEFATHNEYMPQDDLARNRIAQFAMNSLLDKHDIKNYISLT